jgi:hypothetical protein
MLTPIDKEGNPGALILWVTTKFMVVVEFQCDGFSPKSIEVANHRQPLNLSA